MKESTEAHYSRRQTWVVVWSLNVDFTWLAYPHQTKKSSLKLELSLCQHGLMKSRLVGEKVQTWFGRLSPLRRSRYFIVHRLSLREKKKEPGTFLKLNSKTLRWLGSNATRPDVVWRLSLLFGNRYNDSLSRSLMVEAERPGITNRTATHAQLHAHS